MNKGLLFLPLLWLGLIAGCDQPTAPVEERTGVITVLPLPDLSLLVDSVAVLDLTAYFKHTAGQQLSFRISTEVDSMVALVLDGHSLEITGTNRGEAEVEITASDETGYETARRLEVAVDFPYGQILSSRPFEAITLPDAGTVYYDLLDYFAYTKPDSLSFSVTTNAPVTATVEANRYLSIGTSGTGTGTSTVTVTATDPWGHQLSQSFAVTVSPSLHTFWRSNLPKYLPLAADTEWHFTYDGQEMSGATGGALVETDGTSTWKVTSVTATPFTMTFYIAETIEGEQVRYGEQLGSTTIERTWRARIWQPDSLNTPSPEESVMLLEPVDGRPGAWSIANFEPTPVFQTALRTDTLTLKASGGASRASMYKEINLVARVGIATFVYYYTFWSPDAKHFFALTRE